MFRKKKVFIVCLLVCMMFLNTGSVSFAKDKKVKGEKQFNVQISYGINGTVRYGDSFPVTVKLTSKVKDFEGKIRFGCDSTEYSNNIYVEKSVTLPKGVEKQISLDMNTNQGSDYYEVQLVDKNNKVVYENKTLTGEMVDSTSLTVGVLSDKEKELKCFKDLIVNESTGTSTSYVKLSAETMPTNQTDFAMLDYLLVDDFDTLKLSNQQYEALKTWVSNGGNLILALGDQYKKVLGKFQDDFLKGTVKSVYDNRIGLVDEKTGKEVSVRCADIESDDLEAELSVATGKCLNFARKDSGRVYVVSFSFTEDSIQKWDDESTFIARMLSCSEKTISKYVDKQNGIGDDTSDASAAVQLDKKNQPPNTYVLLFCFVIYIIVLGPVIYFVLKNKDKREYMWFSMVTCAILFVGILFVYSRFTTISKPIVNTMLFEKYSDDSCTKNVIGSVQNVKNDEVNLKFNDAIQNLGVLVSDDYSVFGNSDATYYLCQDEKAQGIRISSQEALSKSYFKLKEADQRGTKPFQCDINLEYSKISGTIKNVSNRDFTHVVVCFGGQFYMIPDLKSQDSYTIDENTMASSKMPTLSNQRLRYKQFGNNDQFLDYKEFTGAFLYAYLRYVDPSSISIVAYDKNYSKNYLKSTGYEVNQRALVVQKCKNEMIDGKSRMIPDISSSSYVTDGSDYGYYDSVYKYSFDGEIELNYDFTDLSSIEALVLRNPKEAKQRLEITVYNNKTKQFEDAFKSKDVIGKNEIQDYVQDQKTIRIKYTIKNANREHYEGVLPIIDVIGGIKDASN